MAGVQFIALKNFDAEVDGRMHRYVQGLTYTIRAGNKALAEAVAKWTNPDDPAEAPKVQVLGMVAGVEVHSIQGTAVVK